MHRDTIIEKIKKLRALSQSENVGEAAAAAAAVTRLMFAYQLEEAEIAILPETEDPIENWDFLHPGQKGATSWQIVLLDGLARSMFCSAVSCPSHRGHRGYLRVYGTAVNISAVQYLYSAVTGDVERLLTAWADVQPGVGRAERTAFRYGAACAVRNRIILEMTERRGAAAVHQSAALVRVDREANRATEAMRAAIKTKPIRVELRTASTDAYLAGHEAGAHIPVGSGRTALGAPKAALTPG